MKRLPLYICLLFSFVFNIICNAQTDTEFWFAAPEVSYFDGTLDRPIVLRFTTGSLPANVEVTQPAGGGMPDQSLSIAANSTMTLDVTDWLENIEAKPANTVLNYGIKITSSAPITAYYEVVTGPGGSEQLNPEVFVLKGKNAIGTDFVIPSQNLMRNHPVYTPAPKNAFTIIALEDDTEVYITPSKSIVGHAAGDIFSINLDQGQVYTAQALSELPEDHLDGSYVSTVKPIAITVSDDLLHSEELGGCADLGGDQIIPIQYLGTEYIAMNGELNSPNSVLFITATEDGTTISKDGTSVGSIDAFETYQMIIAGASTYVETNKKVAVWQLNGIGCEVGLAILPQITCTGSSTVSYTRSQPKDLYLDIFTQSGNESGFIINGSSSVLTASMFDDVPGTGGTWVAASVSLPSDTYPAGSVIRVDNSIGKFHMGVLDGGATGGTSYGYFSDFGYLSAPNAQASTACEGDTIKLFAGVVSEGYSWLGPDGFTSSEANPIILNATEENVGVYFLTVTSSCGELKDSIFVGPLKAYPIVAANDDTLLCDGDILKLSINEVADGHSITWQGPGGFSSTEKDVEVSFPLPGMYIVRVDNDGCAKSDTVNVEVVNNVEVDLGRDTIICIGKPLTLDASGSNGNYLWSNGSINSKLIVEETGKYWVEITLPPSCKSSDTIDVEFVHCEACIPLVPSAFSPNNDGMNDIFRPVYKPYCFVYNYHMQIYSRWGQRLYNSFRIEDGWNGWVHDKTADLGVYMYYITYRESADGEEIVIKGDVTLLR